MTNRQDRRVIRQIAYQKWEAAGRPDGEEMRFWLESEREYLNQPKDKRPRDVSEEQDQIQEASEQSFPASDPPAWNTGST
jgi:hypothetical protein